MKNPFDGLIMHVDFEEREWTGAYAANCAMCIKEMIYPVNFPVTEGSNVPIILTYVEHAHMDADKYFCSYDCMEDWINKFALNFI